MNVKDIIRQASIAITGIPAPSEEEESYYLSVLNSAHIELWDIATDYFNNRYCSLTPLSAEFGADGVELANFKKVFFAFLTKYGDIEEKPYEFLLNDIGFTQRETIKYYTVLQSSKSCKLYLHPLPQLSFRQSVHLGYSTHATELLLGDQAEQIPYDSKVVQGLLLGVCAKAIASNLGSADKNEYNYYIQKWEEFKNNFRADIYAISPKKTGRFFNYV